VNVDSVRDNLTKPVIKMISQESLSRKDAYKKAPPTCILLRGFSISSRYSRNNTVRNGHFCSNDLQIAPVTALKTIFIPLIAGTFYEQVTLTTRATF